MFCFFFSSRRRHTRWTGDWSSDVCSSDLAAEGDVTLIEAHALAHLGVYQTVEHRAADPQAERHRLAGLLEPDHLAAGLDGPERELAPALVGIGRQRRHDARLRLLPQPRHRHETEGPNLRQDLD